MMAGLAALAMAGCFAAEVPVREAAALDAWHRVEAADRAMRTAARDIHPGLAPAPVPGPATRLPGAADTAARAALYAGLVEAMRRRAALLRRSREPGHPSGGGRMAAETAPDQAGDLRAVTRVLGGARRFRVAAAAYDARRAAFVAARDGWPGRLWAVVLSSAPADVGMVGPVAGGRAHRSRHQGGQAGEPAPAGRGRDR